MAEHLREFGKGLIDPKYCCCAVPLVNFGIYAIMGEQFLLGIGIGVGALATPKVLGASFPSFATIIFAITCFIVGGLQPLGFIGVMREKTKTFKFYAMLDLLALAAAFSTSAALIIVSALNHNSAVSSCIKSYYTPESTASASATSMLNQQAPLICGPFAWAGIGIMGGLWVVLLVLQLYFAYLTRLYSTSQVSDHKLYHSVYSENPEAFTMSILQSKRYNPNSVYSAGGLPRPPTMMRDDVWSARGSMESQRQGVNPEEVAALRYGHAHQPSQGGYQAGAEPGQYAYNAGPQAYASGVDDGGRYDDAVGDHRRSAYNYGEPSYAAGGGGYGQQAYGYGGGGGYVDPPPDARYGREPGPTPELNQYRSGEGVGFDGGGGGLSRPGAVQNHPAEGMFGRKSPRPRDY